MKLKLIIIISAGCYWNEYRHIFIIFQKHVVGKHKIQMVLFNLNFKLA